MKYGRGAKASEFFARMSVACRKQEEAIPALTPLKIPPRSQTLIETPTSQALSTHQENPQILPETLIQEITPAVPNPQIETQFPTETALEDEETTEMEGADTIEEEEDESKAGGDEQDARIGDEETTGAGEGVDGNEGSKAEEEEEVVSEGEGVEKQVMESKARREEESEEEEGKKLAVEEVEGGLEGRIGKVDEEIADDDEEIGEKAEEKDGDESESAPIVEEEVENREEKEAEIVLLDDVTTDDQETPADKRLTRRHSRWNKKSDDEALASRAKKLRLSDTEETRDDIPQAQKTLATEGDISQ